MAKKVAQIIAALNIIMVIGGLVLVLSVSKRLVFDISPLVAIVYSVLGALIISRHPRHTVGWLFLIIGFFSAFGSTGGVFSESAFFTSSEGAFIWLAWAGHIFWIPVFMVPITLVLQFFPDGRLPSPRWWPVMALTIMGMFGVAASIGFHPWPWEEQDILDPYNPFGIAGSEQFFESLLELSIVFFALGLIGSLLSVVVRFLRSRETERIQMKWLVYTAVVGIVPLLLLPETSPIGDFLFRLLPILFALAVGIAILRYRLFDIDVIIRRTLQYTILTASLVLIYFGLIIILQSIFSAVGGQESEIFIVISTLVIAGLFNPLRLRIQNTIDRRFYRKKYHAEQALAQFNTTVRDQVEMDKIATELLGVVKDTMQPEQVSLWLPETSSRRERA